MSSNENRRCKNIRATKKEWFLAQESIYGNSWWWKKVSLDDYDVGLMLRKTNHSRKVFRTFNLVPFLHELDEKDAKAARNFYGL